MSNSPENEWQIFQGSQEGKLTPPHDGITRLPPAPNWRPFGKAVSPGVSRRQLRGRTFLTRPNEVKMVNAALYLRRPLLITGRPGTGKSSLAYAIAQELKLGEVLYWPITTRTTLTAGLYSYDAIGRLQEVKQMEAKGQVAGSDPQQVADFITLGPLGTALLPSPRPRVLLIDEIDKSDIDLPNDLLTIFEEGRFEIPELLRLEKDDPDRDSPAEPISVRIRTAYTDLEDEITQNDRKVTIPGGRITCQEFPLVILTSNGERDFPPPFLRRCLRLNMHPPDHKQLVDIVKKHFAQAPLEGSTQSSDQTSAQNSAQEQQTPAITEEQINFWVKEFLAKRDDQQEQLATDQLLNALFVVARECESVGDDLQEFIKRFLLAPLDRPLPANPDKAEKSRRGK